MKRTSHRSSRSSHVRPSAPPRRASCEALEARRLLAVAPVAAPFQLSTYTSGDQRRPGVAMDADGDFVATWYSVGQDGDAAGTYAQRFNAAAAKQGAEFQVNTYTAGQQNFPDVAMDDGGKFAVAWDSYWQVAGDDAYVQRYAATGAKLGGETLANTYTSGDQLLPAIAMDADGDFVVVWTSDYQDGGDGGIYGQRFSAAGAKLGGEFIVNTTTAGNQFYPVVAMDAAGNFVVAWNAQGQDGSGSGIYARLYNASGVAQGSEFKVNSFTAGDQKYVAAAMAPAGEVVLAWHSAAQDGAGQGIYAQRYSSAGVAQGTEFRVNAHTAGDQMYPALAVGSGGAILVAWQGAGASGGGVYARQFSNSGAALTGDLLVATSSTVSDIYGAPGVSVAADRTGGRYVVAYESSGVDGSGWGVSARLYRDSASYATASGVVFNDSDFDGAQDVGEAGLASWTIFADEDADGVADATEPSATTGANGAYTVAVAAGAPVRLAVTPPAGAVWSSTVPAGGWQSLTLSPGEARAGVNFGFVASTLSGWVYEDRDADGVRDAGEAGLTAWQVFVDADADGALDANEPSAFTGDNGAYTLLALPGTDLRLTLRPQDLWTRTAPPGGVLLATLALGEAKAGLDLGVSTATPAAPAATAAGAAFRVNTYTTSDQRRPALARRGDGEFVAAWMSTGQDGDGDGTYVQRFNATGGKLGAEALVNATTTGHQNFPDVAVRDSTGDFVVVWDHYVYEILYYDPWGWPVYGETEDIYFQRYDAAGVPQGGAVRANSTTANGQYVPTVAMDAAGNFVVAWTGDLQDGSGEGIYAQRYSAAGAPLGAEFRVNTTTAGNQFYPVIGMSPVGDFVVAWNSDSANDQGGGGAEGSGHGIFAQRFNASGAKVGGEFRVNSFTAGEQKYVSAAMGADGSFVLTWQSQGQDAAGGWGAYAQRYSAAGVPQGGEFRVNTQAAGDQMYPVAAVGPAGDITFVWQGAGASGNGVYARRYSAAGVPAAAGPFLVATTPAVSEARGAPGASVATDANGDLVIAWEATNADGAGYGILARRYAIVTPQPPAVAAPIADVIAAALTDANSAVSLFPAFNDPDTPDASLTFSVTSTNPALFSSTAVGPATGVLVLTYAPGAVGSADVTVRAADPNGLWAEDTFTVTRVPLIRGSAADDAWVLRGTADGASAEVYLNRTPADGAPNFTLALAGLDPIVIDAGEGDDRLTLDFSAGSPVPTSGLAFNGGAQATSAGDRVRLVGTPGGDLITAGAAALTLGEATATLAGAEVVEVDGGGGADDVSVADGGALVRLLGGGGGGGGGVDWAGLNLYAAARVALPSGAGAPTFKVAGFTAAADATLDLADSRLVVQATDTPGALANLQAVLALVRAGRLAGPSGPGLVSSTAAAESLGLRSVAAIANDDGSGSPLVVSPWHGVPVDAFSVLVAAALDGDGDLSGSVDADDYLRADRGFMSRLDADPGNDRAGFAHGDVNDDGRIDAADYFRADRAFALQGGAGLAAAGAASLFDAPAEAMRDDLAPFFAPSGPPDVLA